MIQSVGTAYSRRQDGDDGSFASDTGVLLLIDPLLACTLSPVMHGAGGPVGGGAES